MKKIFLFAASVAALSFASCSNDGGNTETGKEPTQLSIRLAGVVPSSSRAVEAPGQTAVGTIQLTDGHIFIVNPLDGVIDNEPLNVTDAKGAGQTFPRPVPADSRVFILGNIPSDAPAMNTLTTLAAVKAVTSDITLQSNYAQAALANSDGQPTGFTASNGTASVSVSIKPLISRLELVQIEGASDITAFTVTGVYVDDYYPRFTLGGGYSGTMFSLGSTGTYNGATFYKNEGTWAAAQATAGDPFIAVPELSSGSGEVWAYNVAPGSLPRLIVRLSGVKYNPGTGEVDLGTTPHYLTMTGYTNLGSAAFERGKIYRLSGSTGFQFDHDDLGLVPNPVDIDLTVQVQIDEWEIVAPDAVL